MVPEFQIPATAVLHAAAVHRFDSTGLRARDYTIIQGGPRIVHFPSVVPRDPEKLARAAQQLGPGI